MDLHDLDQTQAIFRDESEDDGTDELLPDAERQPKSFLKVLFQKGMTEKSYPVYEGENIIGRNANTCHICIPSQALSKEHACIEVIKDLHVIYDKGSRNKTKWKKTFLTPNVRFELNTNDEISFADIKCLYIKQDPDLGMSNAEGSETDGSESFLLQMELSKDKNVSGQSPSKTSLFADLDGSNAGSAEDRNDCDSPIPPTQTFASEKASKPALCIQETPERSINEHPSTVVLTESESDDEETNREKRLRHANGRPSTVICADSDSLDSDNFCMATQAYFSDSNKDKKDGDPSEAPTQVCQIDEPTQACHNDEPTQAFIQKEEEDEASVTASANSSRGQSTDGGESKSTDGTQSFDVNSNLNTEKTSDDKNEVLISTQVFEEEEEDENEEAAARLFAMSTMAPQDEMDEEDKEMEEEMDNDKAKSDGDVESDGVTLPVNSDATVVMATINENAAVENEAKGNAEPTQAYGHDNNDMETQQYGDDDANTDKTSSDRRPVALLDEPTQVYRSTSEDNDTQAFDDCVDHKKTGGESAIQTVAITEPTQVVTEEEPTQMVALDEPTQLVSADEPIQKISADNPTQKISTDDPTQSITADEPTQMFSIDEPTQMFSADEPTQRISADEPTQRVSADEPTQRISADEPTQTFSADEPTQMVFADEPTQRVDVDQPTQAISTDEPTQKFDFPDNEDVPRVNSENRKEKEPLTSDDDSDLECSMLKTDNVLGNEATQVFDMEPLYPETVKDNVQPTMEYRMDVQEDDATANQSKDSKKRKRDVRASPQAEGKKQAVAPKDSPLKKVEATTSADSENYSYPMSPVIEDIVDTQEMTSESPPLPKSSPNPPPAHSPLKSALVDRKRTPSPSPSPKRVAFKESTINSPQKETDTSPKQRLSRRTAAAGKQSDASDPSHSKRGRKSTVRFEEISNTKDDGESDSNKKTAEDSKDRKKEKVASSSETLPTSRRGRRKKGAASEDNGELEEKTDTLAVTSTALSEKKDGDLAEVGAETVRNQQETGTGLRGRASKRQKTFKLSAKTPHSSEADKEIDGKNESNIKTSLKQFASSENQMVEADGQETGSEQKDKGSDVSNSTSRRGRRITRNTLYKDFDTGGIKKRESISKPTKNLSGVDLDKGNDEGCSESQDSKKAVSLPEADGLDTPLAVTNSRKRKNSVEKNIETTGEQSESISSSKRTKRGTRLRQSESTAKESTTTSTASETTPVVEQSEKLSGYKSRASVRTALKKINSSEQEESKNSGKVSKEDKTSLKKDGGRKSSLAKDQDKEKVAETEIETAKPSVDGETKQETPVPENTTRVKPQKGGKKGQGKETQKASAVSTTARGRRGASSTATSGDEENNVKQSIQEPTKGKRKKPTPEEESQVCTPPAKRGKMSVDSAHKLRQSTMDNKPKVMFTGIIDEEGEKTVKDLGGELVTNIQECSHLVTDKIRRTVKFLGCLCKGVFIVSQQWLDGSKRAGTFLNGQNFLVKDKDMEKQYKFSLATSINVAKRQPLFESFHIHVSKSVKPDPNQMRDILQCSGAEVLPKMPSKAAENTVVISCPSDEKLCKPAIKVGIPVVTAEFILTGILQQKVDIAAHRLFHNDSS